MRFPENPIIAQMGFVRVWTAGQSPLQSTENDEFRHYGQVSQVDNCLSGGIRLVAK